MWDPLIADIPPQRLQGTLFRIVESQEQIATSELVDTLEEQSLLEEMLENSKPPVVPGTERLHYLLATPFRYPPLQWGSRFGQTHEPRLFYAGCDKDTALVETAYYRLVFWSGMVAPPPSGQLKTQHTLFTATYDIQCGYDLREPPFDAHQGVLTHPTNYQPTQMLGSALRNQLCHGFEYATARSDMGTNVALFTPDAIVSDNPTSQASLICQTNATQVQFLMDGQLYSYPATYFMVNATLPMPA